MATKTLTTQRYAPDLACGASRELQKLKQQLLSGNAELKSLRQKTSELGHLRRQLLRQTQIPVRAAASVDITQDISGLSSLLSSQLAKQSNRQELQRIRAEFLHIQRELGRMQTALALNRFRIVWVVVGVCWFALLGTKGYRLTLDALATLSPVSMPELPVVDRALGLAHRTIASRPPSRSTPPSIAVDATHNGPSAPASALPWVAAVQSTSGDINALRRAIISQESSGNFRAVNPDSGALGYGQVMPDNLPTWSRDALGHEVSPSEFLNNPNVQIAIVNHKLAEYLQEELAKGVSEDIAIRRAASRWYAGDAYLYDDAKPQVYGEHQYPSVRDYTLSILQKYQTHD